MQQPIFIHITLKQSSHTSQINFCQRGYGLGGLLETLSLDQSTFD